MFWSNIRDVRTIFYYSSESTSKMTWQILIILLNQHPRWQDNLLLFFWTNTRNDRTKSNCSSEPTRRFLIILLNQRAENKQSHHLNVKCSDTTLLSNNITTKINNPSSECQACRYNTSYTQHYDENKTIPLSECRACRK